MTIGILTTIGILIIFFGLLLFKAKPIKEENDQIYNDSIEDSEQTLFM